LVSIADGYRDHELALALLVDAAGVRQRFAVRRRARSIARARASVIAIPRCSGAEPTFFRSAGLLEQRLDARAAGGSETEPERRRSSAGVARGDAPRPSAIKARPLTNTVTTEASTVCAPRWRSPCWQVSAFLERRAAASSNEHDARRDRVRIAGIQASELGDRAAAIDTWKLVREKYGADRESFEALGALLHAEERWAELA
jgi:hypothetical protein